MTQDQTDKFYDLLNEFENAMFISHHGDKLYARPMAIAKVEKSCDLWFISAEATEKIGEIRSDPRVHITCQRDHGCYLSMSGTAATLRDRKKLEELWKPEYQVWFPEGKDDPRITLISMKADSGEYWDNRGTKGISYVFKAVAALGTGTTPRIKEGDQHGQVNL